MIWLYIADVVTTSRIILGTILMVCGPTILFSGIMWATEDDARIPRLVCLSALGTALAMAVLLTLTPSPDLVRQMGGLVPMRKHQDSHGDACTHVIWTTKEKP